MPLGNRPFGAQEGYAFGKLAEYIEAFDGYVCTLDELLSRQDLQEGGFPGCFAVGGGFL